MRFFSGENEISFAEFKAILPAEAKLLEGHLEIMADFELDQRDHLLLRSETTGPMGINIPKMMDYHRQFFYKNSVYDQPLAKALGVKRGRPRPWVLDATAGTLKDTCLILSMGLEVVACERHPVAQALIINSLGRNPLEGLRFVPSDVKAFQEVADFDAIYFDPMYESPSKKSAPRKEMRIFRDVVKPDEDAKDTAEKLLNTGKRLVIKRPVKASPLLGPPHVSFGKKSTQYDVYLQNLQ